MVQKLTRATIFVWSCTLPNWIYFGVTKQYLKVFLATLPLLCMLGVVWGAIGAYKFAEWKGWRHGRRTVRGSDEQE